MHLHKKRNILLTSEGSKHLMNDNIYGLVQDYRNNYKYEFIKLADGYEFSQYQQLNLIELYFNSRFETGPKDSQGVTKAFYNINKSRVQVETRATDIDTKDLQITTDDMDQYTKAMLFSKENKKWIKEAQIGKFLNEAGFTASKCGGVLIKKTEKKGVLNLSVVPWKYLTTDQTDIMNGIIIEQHYYTPSQLLKMKDSGWENLNEAIQTAKQSKAQNYETGTVPTQGEYIEVWEVHGEMPTYFMTGEYPDPANIEYSRQIHIITGLTTASVNNGSQNISQGITLFKGLEKENPYKYYNRQKVDGRALGVGVVEDCQQAQVWTNKAINEEKKVMELAGKVIFQQQGKGVVKNILSDVDNGAILDNKGAIISQLQSTPTSLPHFQNLIDKWNTQAERVTSTFAAVTGADQPSGTPYRSVALQNQEANSQFEYLKENFGLFLQEVYMDWVFPYLTRKLKDPHTLTSDFSVEELQIIDESFINYNVNQHIKEQILSGKIVTQEQIDGAKDFYREFIQKTSNKRGLTIPKGYYDGIEWKLDIHITNEQRIKAVYLETLSNILTTVAQNPAVLTDPKMSQIFGEIMQVAGFNSERLTQISNAKSPQPQQTQTQTNQPNPAVAT